MTPSSCCSPAASAGIFVEDMDKQLAGLKPGETKTLTLKAPEDHPREDIRGKEVQIEVTIKDIKKLELAEVNQEFLDSLGFKDENELREALKEQMEIAHQERCAAGHARPGGEVPAR